MQYIAGTMEKSTGVHVMSEYVLAMNKYLNYCRGYVPIVI